MILLLLVLGWLVCLLFCMWLCLVWRCCCWMSRVIWVVRFIVMLCKCCLRWLWYWVWIIVMDVVWLSVCSNVVWIIVVVFWFGRLLRIWWLCFSRMSVFYVCGCVRLLLLLVLWNGFCWCWVGFCWVCLMLVLYRLWWRFWFWFCRGWWYWLVWVCCCCWWFVSCWRWGLKLWLLCRLFCVKICVVFCVICL